MLPDLYREQSSAYEDAYDLDRLYSTLGLDNPYTAQEAGQSQHTYGDNVSNDTYEDDAQYAEGLPGGAGQTDDYPMTLSFATPSTGEPDATGAPHSETVSPYLAADEDGVYSDLLAQYGLDANGGWDLFETVDEMLEPEESYDVVLDGDDEPAADTAYDVELDEALYEQLLEDGPAVYGRYAMDEDDLYVEIAEIDAYDDDDEVDGLPYDDLPVVEHEMPDGLFGFVDPTETHPVAHVNKALYKVDKERTRSHEASRATGHPSNWADDELTIRYRNGDIDVQNTLSYQADRGKRAQTIETGYMPWEDGKNAAQYATPDVPVTGTVQYGGA